MISIHCFTFLGFVSLFGGGFFVCQGGGLFFYLFLSLCFFLHRWRCGIFWIHLSLFARYMPSVYFSKFVFSLFLSVYMSLFRHFFFFWVSFSLSIFFFLWLTSTLFFFLWFPHFYLYHCSFCFLQRLFCFLFVLFIYSSIFFVIYEPLFFVSYFDFF